jgi:GTP-binding protein
LTPHLGVVALDTERSFCVADIPGLIAGAHAGLGLGDRFLRHVERTRLLVHLVDVSDTAEDPWRDFAAVRRELELAPGNLAGKPFVVALNKIDAATDPRRLKRLQARFERRGLAVHRISAVSGEGVRALLEAVAARLAQPVEVEPSVEVSG